MRICLAASGGGHLRQILDLRSFWSRHDYYFVTEPTAMAETLETEHRVLYVPHFAFGLRKIVGLWATLRFALGNLIASWLHAREMRPDLVISTGAGSAFFTVLFARLFGARFILIETIARVHKPSLFGRLAKRLAHLTIVQSGGLLETWPDAIFIDPIKRLGPVTNPKENLGFVTVGTVMPFDRLVYGVADLADMLPEKIIAQVGDGGARPDLFNEVHERMNFNEIMEILKRADVVFCHGGTGSLITALQAGCRVVAMPRQSSLLEHYDDHQTEIVEAFVERGLIQMAKERSEIRSALERAIEKLPERVTIDAGQIVEVLERYAAHSIISMQNQLDSSSIVTEVSVTTTKVSSK